MKYFSFIILAFLGLIAHGQMVEGTAETYHSGTQTIKTYFNNGQYELRDLNKWLKVQVANGDALSLINNPLTSNVYSNTNDWQRLNTLEYLILNEVNIDLTDVYFTISDLESILFDSRKSEFSRVISENQTFLFSGVQSKYDNLIITFFRSGNLLNSIEVTNIQIPVNAFAQSNVQNQNISVSYKFKNEENYSSDILYGLQSAHFYFQFKFNRNSEFNLFQNLKAYIHRGLSNEILSNGAKANTDTNKAIFGAGISNYRKPSTSIEVVAHEYMHFVLSRENKFQRRNGFIGQQAGNDIFFTEIRAINESICDAFGVIVRHFVNTNGLYSSSPIDWKINKFGVGTFSNEILRDMSEPASDDMIHVSVNGIDPDNDRRQPDFYQNDDPNISLTAEEILQGPNWVGPSYNLGDKASYKNMGPANYWFYLIANEEHKVNPKTGINSGGFSYSVKSFGLKKAEELLYYLISESPDLKWNSKYRDYANASINAAEYFLSLNLHDFTNEDIQSIKDAWYAVGVLDNPNEFCNSGIVLTSTTGNLEDGSLNQGYNNDQNCSWTIAPSGASSVTLNFTDFDLGNGDSVIIYDGLDNTAIPIGTYTGITIPDEIISTTGAVFIEFTTDSADVGQGWSLEYTSSTETNYCNALTEIFLPNGTINDGSGDEQIVIVPGQPPAPGETGTYLNNSACSWRIAPENATFINLDFQFIDLENNEDFVTIYDGLDESATPLGTFTGNTVPSTVIANSGTAFIKFTSNNQNNFQGWSLNYTSDGIEPCFGTTTLTDASGIVSDGSGSDNYGNNANCSWLIQPPNATSITLNFDELKLQSVTSDGNTTTFNDYIEIYDGDEAVGEPMVKYAGNQLLPLIVESSGGSLFVKFKSNNSITDAGWQFTYTSSTDDFCSGTTILDSDTGTITDGSTADNYKSNSDCRWLIQPENATSIELNVTFLDTELGKDGIVVYDGPNTTYPYTSYSGTNLPETIYSSGGAMLIRFLSDAQNEFGGFELNYTANIAPEGNANSIVSYEYWFNDDYTNAIKANNFGAVNTLSLNLQSNTANLANGLNTLNIRTKDIIGNWSSVVSEYVYVQNSTASGTNTITEYEYWYNDDYISKVSGIGTDTSTLLLSLQSGVGTLEKGLHQFHIRFKDEKGLWSSIVSEFIYINNPEGLGNNNIVGYKYWFNDDYENRTSESVEANETLFFIENIDISGLENSSSNFIHFQFKDTYGNWSSVITEEFFFQTLSNNGFDSKEFDIYPNPSNGEIFLITNQNQGSLTIYNNLGQQMQSLNYIPEKLNIKTFDSGIYIFKIENQNGVYQKKIIKY